MKTLNQPKIRQTMGTPERKAPDVDRFLMSLGGSVAGGAFLGASILQFPGAVIGAAVGAIAAVTTLRR